MQRGLDFMTPVVSSQQQAIVRMRDLVEEANESAFHGINGDFTFTMAQLLPNLVRVQL